MDREKPILLRKEKNFLCQEQVFTARSFYTTVTLSRRRCTLPLESAPSKKPNKTRICRGNKKFLCVLGARRRRFESCRSDHFCSREPKVSVSLHSFCTHFQTGARLKFPVTITYHHLEATGITSSGPEFVRTILSRSVTSAGSVRPSRSASR